MTFGSCQRYTYIVYFAVFIFFFLDRHIIRSCVLFNFFLCIGYIMMIYARMVLLLLLYRDYIIIIYCAPDDEKPAWDLFFARGRLIRNRLKRFSYPRETITTNERKNKKNQQKTLRIVIYRDFLVYLCGAPE